MESLLIPGDVVPASERHLRRDGIARLTGSAPLEGTGVTEPRLVNDRTSGRRSLGPLLAE